MTRRVVWLFALQGAEALIQLKPATARQKALVGNPLAQEKGQAFSKAGFAYETIRRKIIDGAYQPGYRLRLSELASELDLSEMPVREALRLLQKDGLVILRLHCGAEVARLSFQRGRDLTEARMALERAAALAALPHHSADLIAAIERLHLAMERVALRPVKFAVRNRAFCTALFAPCPNSFLRQQIEELWDQVWQASSTSVFEAMSHRVKETIDENRLILDHLRKGDARHLAMTLDRRMTSTIAAWDGAVERAERAAVQPQPSQRRPPRRQSRRANV